MFSLNVANHLIFVIQISHWRPRATEVAEVWISCKRPKLLRKVGRWQLIQNSAPSVAWRHQIRIANIAQTRSWLATFKDNYCKPSLTKNEVLDTWNTILKRNLIDSKVHATLTDNEYWPSSMYLVILPGLN